MKRIPLLFLFALLLTGCPDRREEKPSPGSMPDEEVELSEAAFDELEGWQEDEMAEMADLFAANCGKIEKLKTPFIDNSPDQNRQRRLSARLHGIFPPENKQGKRIQGFRRRKFHPLPGSDGRQRGRKIHFLLRIGNSRFPQPSRQICLSRLRPAGGPDRT